LSAISAQQFTTGSPEWLVDMFFNQSEFPDKANYFSGEMLNDIDEPTIGEELSGEGEVLFHQIYSANDRIIFAVELEQDENIIDFYCYLIKQDDEWKINAIRRFLLPQFIYTVCDSLSKLKSLSSQDSTFYLSLKLFTMNDKGLKKYLIDNLKKFQELIYSFVNKQGEEMDKNLASLGCNAIYVDNKYPGCAFIQILIFENMESGFIFTDESATLPVISESNFIYLEEVLEGWYIFRKI
jgi:hypothetical protein